MTDEQPPAKLRSKRLYIYWGAALALLAAAGLFSWLVVVPVMQVHAVADRRDIHYEVPFYPQRRSEESRQRVIAAREQAIAELGGRVTAARKLRLWLRVPAWLLGGEDMRDLRALGVLALLDHCEKRPTSSRQQSPPQKTITPPPRAESEVLK